MREMLARTDNDFVVTPARRPRRAAKKPARPAAIRALFRNPGRTVGGAAAAGLAVGILVNALALQGGPHPAPFFRQVTEAPRPVAPMPPERPAAAAPTAPVPAVDEPVARPARAAPSTAGLPASIPLPPPGRDAIGDLLKGGQPVPAADKVVLAAQKALTKLNYGPVKADGLMGAGTKQAIEKFERDRKLPVTGDLGPRTVRELSVAAGMPLE